MRAPDARASLSAIATACFRLLTLPALPARPDFSWPCLYSRITFLTLLRPLLDAFLVAGICSTSTTRIPPPITLSSTAREELAVASVTYQRSGGEARRGRRPDGD